MKVKKWQYFLYDFRMPFTAQPMALLPNRFVRRTRSSIPGLLSSRETVFAVRPFVLVQQAQEHVGVLASGVLTQSPILEGCVGMMPRSRPASANFRRDSSVIAERTSKLPACKTPASDPIENRRTPI